MGELPGRGARQQPATRGKLHEISGKARSTEGPQSHETPSPAPAAMKVLLLIPISAAALVVCKLVGFVNWSWPWVLSPLWSSFLLFTAGVFFLALYINTDRD
jgi:hypothetical protein